MYRSTAQEQDGGMIMMNLSNLQCHDQTSESIAQPQSESTPENPEKEVQKEVKVEEPVILEYHLGDDSDVIFLDVPEEIITVQDSTEDMFQNVNDSNGSDSGILGESLISVQTQPQPERQVSEL